MGEQNPQRDQRGNENIRQQLDALADDGIENVAAIQLPDRQQIQSRRQQSGPGGPRQRMQREIVPGDAGKNDGFEKSKEERRPEDHVALQCDSGNDFRERQADEERREQREETRQRPGDSDVEDRALAGDLRTDLDESAERSDQRWGRQKERQRHVDVIVFCRKEVAHLVAHQNRQ